MFKSQKHAFWISLILTLFVFSGGIFLGYLLENSRTSVLENLYTQSEIELLDVRIQNEIYSFADVNCDNAITENINFASRIYDEAKLLDKYESSNKLSDDVILQHKKYDLLRTLFWINAIKLKQKCNASYHNLVYLYDYNNPRLDTKAKQAVFSRLLTEVKQDKGQKVMLIPTSGDNEITSLSLLMDLYNVTVDELPVILIDEKIKITDIETKEDLDKFLS